MCLNPVTTDVLLRGSLQTSAEGRPGEDTEKIAIYKPRRDGSADTWIFLDLWSLEL